MNSKRIPSLTTLNAIDSFSISSINSHNISTSVNNIKLTGYLLADFKRSYCKNLSSNQRVFCLHWYFVWVYRVVYPHMYMLAHFENMYFYSASTHARFEDVCLDYFMSCIDLVEKGFWDAKISKGNEDEVELVNQRTVIMIWLISGLKIAP